MTYADAVSYLLTFGQELKGLKFDLANVTRLLAEIGRPEHAWDAIHVAGTNGKGSVAAMLEAVLRHAGVRTGLYTSPHLVRVNERVRVAGREISAEEFAQVCTCVRAATERLLARHSIPAHPSFFESLTAIAFEHFRRADCQLAVLETGMGGRLDATNVVTPLVSVITRIDYDHEAYLGNALEQIAFEKAGIIKPGVPVITVPQPPEAAAVLEREAGERGAPLIVTHPETVRAAGVRLALAGEHQLENAAAVIGAVEQLRAAGIPISDGELRLGLETTEWPGRLEFVPGSPPLLLDGAHNLAGARALQTYLRQEFAGRRLVLMFGAMRDKPIAEIAEILFPGAAGVVLTRPRQRRAASPETIADVAPRVDADISIAPESREALRVAREKAGASGVVVVTGSLYLVGEVKEALAGE